MPQLYSVADSLQEILARQKLEARQAMLDEISRKELENRWKQQELENTRNRDLDVQNRKESEARMLYNTENLKSLQENRQTTNEAKVLNQIGTMFAPDEQLPSDMDPEVSGILDKYQRTKKTFTPSIDAETAGTQDVNKIYRGSPEDLAESRTRQRIQQYLKKPGISDEVKKALEFQSEVPGVNMPAGMFGRQETSDIQEYKQAVSQGYKGTYPDWVKFVANVRNPVQRPATFGYAGTDPKTNLPLTLENTTGNFYLPGRVPYSGPVAPKPTTTTNKYPPVLSDNASQDLADLRARTGGWVGGQVRRQEAARIQNGIGNAKVDPQVRQVALQIISSSTYDNKDAMEIVQEYRRNLGASPSPQDINLVNQLEALLIQTIGIKPRE